MANGRVWTSRDIQRLYRYAETMSQQDAAKRLDRSWQAVAAKARTLGIRWRQGYQSYASIADEVGCSPTTVRRLAQIVFPDGVPGYRAGTGFRVLLDFEDAERLVRLLRGTRRHREQQIRAGKIRQQRAAIR